MKSELVRLTEQLDHLAPNLPPTQFSLIEDCLKIIGLFKEPDHLSDYSFLVSPVAKAYEGFLKDFFYRLEVIDRYSYYSDRFRVGKTLNPALRHKRFSIFRKLTEYHPEGEILAQNLWDAWKFGRNEIFHYFPENIRKLTYTEAVERIGKIMVAMDQAVDFESPHHH